VTWSEKEVPVAAISRTGGHDRRRPGKPGAVRCCTKARLLRQKKAQGQRIEQQQERRHKWAQIGDGDPDPLLLTNMCRVKDRFNHKN
jgi:hypothetical protein